MGVYVSKIISDLTSRGILYKGKPFLPNIVYGILRNVKYSGTYSKGDEIIDNMYPRIVPQPLFDAVRKRLKVTATASGA